MSELIKNSGMYQRITSSTAELDRLFKEVDEQKSPPDIKKVLLLMGLGTLSWISTYSGLLELIQANSGDIPLTYKLAIGFAVAMLMLMIVYILDQLFAPLNWLLRTIYIFGYIFLTIISVGFGFGFYWKYLESRSEATRSAESAVTQVQTALQAGQSRLEQLETTLTTLTALSLQKAKEERELGNSCPNSRPGDGPRRRLRDNDAKNFSFAGDFVTKRAQSVADDIRGLNGDLAKIASRHPSTVDPTTGTRNAFMKSLNQRLDMTITRFNAFRTDPQLASIRNNLAERSSTTIFPDNRGGTFQCPDTQLQTALRGVVQAIDQLPKLQKPKINASEGSEATIEAFRRLGATLSGMLVFKMPPSEDELREMRKKAVRTLDKKQAPSAQLNAVQPGLNERDYIPLAIAVFVDFCLLLVSINRPMDRLKSLVPVMKEARDGPISGILSSFHATHFTGMREEFSLFQHVVFDWGGHYYVAVPLASNDIQAQYLANLFVSLEGRGIVDRAMIPPGFIIRGKLKKMGSSFADHRAFRLYKFRNGAWSNIVLDAVMGAAKDVAEATRLEANRRQALGLDQVSGDKRAPNFDSLFDDETITLNDNKDMVENGKSPNPKTRIAHNSSDFDESILEEEVGPLPRLFRNAGSRGFKNRMPATNTTDSQTKSPLRYDIPMNASPAAFYPPHNTQLNGAINNSKANGAMLNGDPNGKHHTGNHLNGSNEFYRQPQTQRHVAINVNALKRSPTPPTSTPKAPTPFTSDQEVLKTKTERTKSHKPANLINLPLKTREKFAQPETPSEADTSLAVQAEQRFSTPDDTHSDNKDIPESKASYLPSTKAAPQTEKLQESVTDDLNKEISQRDEQLEKKNGEEKNEQTIISTVQDKINEDVLPNNNEEDKGYQTSDNAAQNDKSETLSLTPPPLPATTRTVPEDNEQPVETVAVTTRSLKSEHNPEEKNRGKDHIHVRKITNWYANQEEEK